MTYIKKLTVHGFKSFARKTEVLFENSMNVIVGPNGSGKSNVTDALCFVLGRLSIKSIRAAKAANLLFSGNKIYKGANEASVELILDNSNKTFPLEMKEIKIKRIVRKNGQSKYKINDETKTRQELLELLGTAGIDPNGFNIVLQGEIHSLVKASSEERRKIIEDVAGISIYESRKEKSLKELEKAEEKLKEISSVLKERSSYLKNLDKERADAMNFQKLETAIKMCKKSIITHSLKGKEKEIWGIDKLIESNNREIEKVKLSIREKNVGIEELQLKISVIAKKIQEETNNEQDVLHNEISDLKAELAGLEVRKQNFQARMGNNREKIDELDVKKELFEKEISEFKTSSPDIKKKQSDQSSLQKKFDLLEQQRRRFYVVKSDLASIEHKKEEKEKYLISSKKEIELIEKGLNSLSNEIKFSKSINEAEELKIKTRNKIEKLKAVIDSFEEKILGLEKKWAVLEEEVKREEKLKNDILGLDSCPICKQQVDSNYKKNIGDDTHKKIHDAQEKSANILNEKDELIKNLKKSEEELSLLQSKVSDVEIEIIKLNNAEDRKNEVKVITEKQNSTKSEVDSLIKKASKLKKEFEELKSVESEYDDIRMKLQDLSFVNIDVDSEIGVKQREIARLSVEKKATIRDLEESEVELKKVTTLTKEKIADLGKKEEKEKKVFDLARKLFDEKNEFEDQQKVYETDIIGLQHNVRNFEERIHNGKINKAQFDAQVNSLKEELREFSKVGVYSNVPVNELKEKLQKSQFRISQLGSVNLRALEVFDQVKEQVKLIEEKVEKITLEKEKILKIVEEIDKKKKKAFMVTLNRVNELFTRNYHTISRKGEVSLELEDKKDPFNGGLNIIVKFSRGKYFDITSLSGGEKSMIALSLIFAIQEYKPYHFYIFDEIDAALDKQNSELLAGLIKKYMKSGQYIIITHNDTLISESSTLYGVSMQENISKIISLKI